MQVNMVLELYSVSSRTEYRELLAYGSRSLSKSEKNYCDTHWELLSLVYFLCYFQAYLLESLFVARTDHLVL